MPRAPRFWGPRAYSPLFLFRFFGSLFQRGAQTVRRVRDSKEPKSPRKREAPKFKKRGPKKRGPKRFLSCFSASARGPKRPKVCRKRQAPKFENRGRKERGPTRFFVPPVSARDPNSTGPQRVQDPQKRSAKLIKNARPGKV